MARAQDRACCHMLAERAGFEPARDLRPLHDFQSCPFGHSGTSPRCVNRAGCRSEPSGAWYVVTFGGESGIRTHGGGSPHNGFRDRRLKPLSHLSLSVDSITGRRKLGHRFLDTPLIPSVPSHWLTTHSQRRSGAIRGAARRSGCKGRPHRSEEGSRPESVADAHRDGCLDSHRAGSRQGRAYAVVPV